MTLATAAVAGLLMTATGLAQTAPPPTQTPPPQTTPKPTPAPQQTPPALPKPPATPVPLPADAKVAFVNLQAVVSESKLGKSGSDQIKALQTKLDGELAAAQKKITDLQKDIDSQQNLLSAASLATKRNTLDELTRQFQYQQNEAQAKLKDLNVNLLAGFEDKVVPIVEAIRKEKGLHVIFAVQGDQGGGLAVMAYDPGVDLTLEVIKRLDGGAAELATVPPATKSTK
jgi:outer membrane protein